MDFPGTDGDPNFQQDIQEGKREEVYGRWEGSVPGKRLKHESELQEFFKTAELSCGNWRRDAIFAEGLEKSQMTILYKSAICLEVKPTIKEIVPNFG